MRDKLVPGIYGEHLHPVCEVAHLWVTSRTSRGLGPGQILVQDAAGRIDDLDGGNTIAGESSGRVVSEHVVVWC